MNGTVNSDLHNNMGLLTKNIQYIKSITLHTRTGSVVFDKKKPDFENFVRTFTNIITDIPVIKLFYNIRTRIKGFFTAVVHTEAYGFNEECIGIRFILNLDGFSHIVHEPTIALPGQKQETCFGASIEFIDPIMLRFSEDGKRYIVPTHVLNMVFLEHCQADLTNYKELVEYGKLMNDIVNKQLRILHTNGLVHMDIKLENIMYHNNNFMLVDYGSIQKAKDVENINDVTHTEMFVHPCLSTKGYRYFTEYMKQFPQFHTVVDIMKTIANLKGCDGAYDQLLLRNDVYAFALVVLELLVTNKFNSIPPTIIKSDIHSMLTIQLSNLPYSYNVGGRIKSKVYEKRTKVELISLCKKRSINHVNPKMNKTQIIALLRK